MNRFDMLLKLSIQPDRGDQRVLTCGISQMHGRTGIQQEHPAVMTHEVWFLASLPAIVSVGERREG